MSIPDFNDSLFIASLLVQIPVDETSVVVDKDFGVGTMPTGAIIITSDCKYGDYGTLEIVHPTAGVVGDLGMVHLPPGDREITVSVDKSNTEVLAGLKYRFTLTAIDALGRNVIIWLMVKK